MTLEQALQRELRRLAPTEQSSDRPTAAAVLTSFNKIEDVRSNLAGLQAQTVPFDRIIVVDNCSKDGTQEMIRKEFPEVHLIEMPDSSYGACETFNIGFKEAGTDYTAILDDDVVLGPEWLEMMMLKMRLEPRTTALLSSKVVEPGMPDWFKNHPAINRERYMSTFRGCASLARSDVLRRCGFYDEDFFIYGNERDLTARILRAGYRVLQYPEVEIRHGTPFGMKTGARSLYYHVRNLWWTLIKHCSLWEIVDFLAGQVTSKFRRGGASLKTDAVGTIGFFKTVRETPGGLLVLVRATLAALWGLPRCLRQREVCTAVDFSPPDT